MSQFSRIAALERIESFVDRKKEFVDIVITFAVEDIDFVDLNWENGHRFTDMLLRQISGVYLIFL